MRDRLCNLVKVVCQSLIKINSQEMKFSSKDEIERERSGTTINGYHVHGSQKDEFWKIFLWLPSYKTKKLFILIS